MTKLELSLNGKPFEIELHDGVEVTITESKLTVRRGDVERAPHTPCIPYCPPPMYPYWPYITWSTGGTVTISDSEAPSSWAVAPTSGYPKT